MKTEKILGGFRQRNIPLSPDYRPMYKVGLIICILKKVTIGNKASLNKLHFFVWALKSLSNMEFVSGLISSRNFSKLVSWGAEPALNKALSLGIADGLFSVKDDKYFLTSLGLELYIKIERNSELFKIEKEFLDSVGKKAITEGLINELTFKNRN